MEKYKEQIICPKCGNDGFTTEYKPERDEKNVPFTRLVVPAAPERIERKCVRCSYVVYQLPLDAKDEEKSI